MHAHASIDTPKHTVHGRRYMAPLCCSHTCHKLMYMTVYNP